MERAPSSNIENRHADIFEVGRASTSDTVERENSDLELSPLRYWQPVQNVAKSWCDVVILASADEEMSGGIETICSCRVTFAETPYKTALQ